MKKTKSSKLMLKLVNFDPARLIASWWRMACGIDDFTLPFNVQSG
jgi:hypothetical protein